MEKLVAVGGGSGFIGRALCKTLEKAGYKTITITRNARGKPNALTWTDVKRNGLPDDTFAVFNVAGAPALNPFQRWGSSLETEIRESRIGTNEILKDSIVSARVPPKFWGSVSAVGFYTPHESTVYDETTAVKKKDYWSELVVEWEKAAELPEGSSTRHCNVRAGIVLGKDGGALANMLLPFKMGLGGAIGSGTQWFPWIHIDDMVGIFMYALTEESVTGILNGVAPEARTNKEFTTCLGSELHRPTCFTIPSFAIQLMYGTPRASMLLEGQNVYPKRTLECGYKYRFPTLPEALKDIVTS